MLDHMIFNKDKFYKIDPQNPENVLPRIIPDMITVTNGATIYKNFSSNQFDPSIDTDYKNGDEIFDCHGIAYVNKKYCYIWYGKGAEATPIDDCKIIGGVKASLKACYTKLCHHLESRWSHVRSHEV